MALNKKVSKNNYSIYTLWLRITKKNIKFIYLLYRTSFFGSGRGGKETGSHNWCCDGGKWCLFLE